MILNKEFYFLRHGQTDGNLNVSLKTSHGDISLNATGIAQAENIEPMISDLPIKTICFSPLKRAKQTKDICCSRLHSVSQHELPNLSECNPEIWQKMTSLGSEASLSTIEPVFSFMQRVRTGINEALAKEGPVLIVAHGGIHWAMCCFMQVEHNWIIDNCVPVHFSFVENRWVARKLERENGLKTSKRRYYE
jgi:uncharacterized phosphatase